MMNHKMEVSEKNQKKMLWDEAKIMLKLSWPMTCTYGSTYLVQPMSIAFCSTLGKTGLDAASLGMTIIMLIVHPVGCGLSFTCNTFFSQLYGTVSQKKIGTYLQRGILLSLIIYILIIVLFINSDLLLFLLGQDLELCVVTRTFLIYLIPGVLGKILFHILSKYLECLDKLTHVCILNFIGVGIGALAHYLFLFQLKMDIRGGGLALGITYWSQTILLIVYIMVTKVYKDNWDGWSRKCLLKWYQFNKDLVPAIIQIIIWCMASEICNILSGMVSKDLLAVQTILFQLDGIGWVIPMGIGFAAVTRISSNFAQNDIEAVKRVRLVTIALQVVFGMITGILYYVLRYPFSEIFTSERQIIEMAAYLMPYVSVYGFLSFLSLGCVSILRATRKYLTTLLITFISMYIIALPIGTPLMFATNWSLEGLLLAVDVGAAVQIIVFAIIIMRLDLEKIGSHTQALIFDETENRTGLTDNQFDETTSLLRSTIDESPKIKFCSILRSKLPLLVAVTAALVAGSLVTLFIDLPDNFKKSDFNETDSRNGLPKVVNASTLIN